MFNKFETYAMGISIAGMALALFVLRNEFTTSTLTTAETESQTGTVFVADAENNRAAIANAIIDAADSVGNIERMIIDDVRIGTGEEAAVGDAVTVHYIGTLQSGQQFDNSYERGTPFTFTLGENRVIAGWEEGVLGMREGGQRILVIPSELGYGQQGFGPIPGGATLVFAIETLEINE